MKKTILSIAAAMLFHFSAYAVQAYNLPIEFMQKDGTTITVIGHGDENVHYYTTADGVLLFHEGNTYYVAGVSENGTIVSTGILAHDADKRNTEEKRAIEHQDVQKFYASCRSAMAKHAASKTGSNVDFIAHNGKVKTLVVLAQFSDEKFTVNEPYKAFQQYLNASGEMADYGNSDTKNYGSVAKYFTDMSSGSFTPEFDLYGPVTLDKPLKTYGEGNDNMPLLVSDVCKAAKNQLDINFANYDSDGDGAVDLIYIIYAGYAESWSGNPTDCIWPKSGTVSIADTFDGKTICRYGVNNELNGRKGQQVGMINGIGLFCHEFSHCMGMPDFYATTAATQECQTAENQSMDWWSIMDLGEYVNNGYRPTAYTAWEREHFGWLDIADLTTSANGVELKSIDNGGKAFRIRNEANTSGNEYIVIENIQKDGWNKSLPGHGMIAYHVEYDPQVFTAKTNTVNNTLGHPRMAMIPADGLLMKTTNSKYANEANVSTLHMAQVKGDPFPGTSNVTELTAGQNLPNFAWYTGNKEVAQSFKNISEDEETGLVTFDFDSPSTGINGIIFNESNNSNIYTIGGLNVGNSPQQLKNGVYVMKNKKFVVKK